MSSAPRSVLLPKLFPKELLALGQLLPNPLNPSISNFSSSILSVGPELTIPAEPEAPYSSFVSLEREGRFSVSLTRLLGLHIGAKHGNFLKIDADAMEYTSLKTPETVFESICNDDSAKEWMKTMAMYKKDFYIVVGLQE